MLSNAASDAKANYGRRVCPRPGVLRRHCDRMLYVRAFPLCSHASTAAHIFTHSFLQPARTATALWIRGSSVIQPFTIAATATVCSPLGLSAALPPVPVIPRRSVLPPRAAALRTSSLAPVPSAIRRRAPAIRPRLALGPRPPAPPMFTLPAARCAGTRWTPATWRKPARAAALAALQTATQALA